MNIPKTQNKNMGFTESFAQRCSLKEVFLEIRKIHRKTLVPEPLF